MLDSEIPMSKTRTVDASPEGGISRRAVLGRLGALAAGTALLGCTPMRIVLKLYPDQFNERDVTDRALRAFVTTVIPGAPFDAPDLTRAFFDPAYPFANYVGFFVADLARRSASLFQTERFDALALAERTRVVAQGFAADATTRKLYSGALLLAQVSFFAGIYDPKHGCELIGFEGEFRPRPLSELTYPEPLKFLSHCATAQGNPA